MSTPAELLAAAHAAAFRDFDADDEVVANGFQLAAIGNGHSKSKKLQINDEEAFPTLGSGSRTSSAGTMGSSTSSTVSSAWGRTPTPMRTQSIQEAFSLDFEAQLNVSKADFSSIMSSIKKATNCRIECTSSSQTKKRTFLISGDPRSVAKAKKEIVRKLTKPVVIEFLVPSSTRAAIIGSGGKNLKPILEKCKVKVDISKSTTENTLDDIFGESSIVKIEGDIQGVNDAKTAILAIVDANTKTVSTKFEIDSDIAPFVKNYLNSGDDENEVYISSSGVVSISGSRKSVIELKEKVLALTKQLNITSKDQIVPKQFHRFIDADEIFQKSSVIVKIPTDGTQNVKFIGESYKIDDAIALAKASSTRHLISSLNIAKAHDNNVEHSKLLALYFKKFAVFDQLFQEVGVQIFFPEDEDLLNPSKEVLVDFVYDNTKKEGFKVAKKAVIERVNSLTPSRVKLISGIDPLIFDKAAQQSIEAAAFTNGVKPVALSPISKGVILVVDPADDDDDDFGPTASEIEAKFAAVSKSIESLVSLSSQIAAKEIEVAASEQSHIAGPNDSTLRRIKSSFVNPIDIIFHTPKENLITVRGVAGDIEAIESLIQETLQATKDYEVASKYFTTFEFPTVALSRLIGKGGANLNTIIADYGVHIDVEKAAEGAKTTTIKVTGIKSNTEEAKEFITQSGKRWADETTSTMKVPQKYQRRLIGPKGAYVNRLQDKYNVKIKFPNDSSEKREEVVIRGPSKGVKKALDEMKDLLNYEVENSHKIVLQVSIASLPRIIGKSGNNMNSLRDEFGVEIEIEDQEDGKTSQIEIIGSKSNIKEVEAKIKAISKEVDNTISVEIEVDPKYYRQILGHNGSNLRKILTVAKAPEDTTTWHRLLVIPDRNSDSKIISSTGEKAIVNSIISQIKEIVALEEASVTEELDIPQEKHRQLIGAGGSVRREIEEKFNITLNIPRITDKSSKVTLKGLPEKVAEAKEYILKLTEDKWAASIEVPFGLHAILAKNGLTMRKLRSEFSVHVEHGNMRREAAKLSVVSSKIPSSLRESESAGWVMEELTIPESVKTIPWRLVGKAEDAQKAKSYLEAELEAGSKFDTRGLLLIGDTSKISKVMGPRGANIDKIRTKSGAIVVIPQATETVNDVIQIVGTQEGVEKAKSEIEKLM